MTRRSEIESDLSRQVKAVLLRHLAPLIADSVFSSALEETAHRAERLSEGDLPLVLPKLERKVRLFVTGASQAMALADLRGLLVTRVPASRVVDINIESDI